MGHSAAGSLRLSLSPSPSRTSWRLKDLCLLKSMLWLSVLDIVKCRSAVGLFCHHGYLIYKASTQPFPVFPVSTQHDPQCPWSQYSSFSGNPRCWVGFQVQYFWHCKIQSYIASHNNLFFLLRGVTILWTIICIFSFSSGLCSVGNSITHQSKKRNIKEEGTHCSLMWKMEEKTPSFFGLSPKM